jgi:hypothetical protein
MKSAKKKRKAARWQCAECGREFLHRNQYHSCGRFQLEPHLRGRSPQVQALFAKLERMLRAAARGGPFRLSPARTLIGLQGRIVYGSLRLGRAWVDVSVLLPRAEPYTDPRAIGFMQIGSRFEHVFRFRTLRELDARAARWLRRAYQAQM